MVAERRSLPDTEERRWRTAAVERAAGARLLQQHRLRLADPDPDHAGEGSQALVREDRRGAEQEQACAPPTTRGILDGGDRSQGFHLLTAARPVRRIAGAGADRSLPC